jgi:tetratricopeptide (TPR) repeat protein
MKRKHFLKNAVLILAIVLLWHFSASASAALHTRYEYQKKDEAQEQKKYMAKLRQDKNKVEMAIESTKALIDQSRTKPYLPELYLRLAELYIEKSRIVYFIRTSGAKASTNALDHLESNTLKKQAIETYQRVLGNFPNFKDRDKVRFFLAHEYRELGQIDEMVDQYQTIVDSHQNSPYVPEAHLLLGDHFFNRRQDLDMALKHYKAVLKHTDSPAAPVARYKLAWCHINKTQFKEAIKLLEECVTTPSTQNLDIDTYKKKVDIKLEALIDMAYCYCEAYKDKRPGEAIAYFRKYAWSRTVYTMVLEKLAYRYFIKKKWTHAAAIYRQLSTLQNDTENLLEYARNIFECVQAVGTFESAQEDMGHIIKALRKQKYSVHIPEEEKEKNLRDYELYARHIVTHLHATASERKSVADFKRAADSYRLYLAFFHDSPVLEDMEENFAEALFSAEDYMEAGKQYEKLAKRTAPRNTDKKEKLYGAVISYYKALQDKEGLNHYQIAFARGGLKTTGKLYIEDFPKSERVPEILFNVAWITYDEGKHDEAIEAFDRFLDQYPRGKEAKVAVHLTLDAFHMKEDYEGLINYGQRINQNARIDEQLRQEVAQIVHAAESKVVSSLTVTALDDWEKGRAGLIDYAEDHISSGLGEQALQALVISGKERGDLETIFSAGFKLISQYPSSSQAQDALGIMIDASLRTAQFRILASHLEEFAKRFPKNENTQEFLYQAGHIRQTLGQYDLANRNYQWILGRPQKSKGVQEEVVFAMAENAEQLGDMDAAIKVLNKNRAGLSEVGKIKADARIADLYLLAKNFEKAQKYRKKAYEAYRPKYAKKDPMLNRIMAQMVCNSLNGLSKKYAQMRLKDRIDNRIVTAKSKLLEKLEKGYNEVIQFQSPEWALAACYACYEINREFASFLQESPIPDLPPEQRTQYMKIIAEKVQGYLKKADQYLQACVTQAHKWEICDPQLAGYFMNLPDVTGASRTAAHFTGTSSANQIGAECLTDGVLKPLHYKLMAEPEDINTLAQLAAAYAEKGDFRHAILVGQKALDELKDETEPTRAQIHNTLGVSYLYIQEDTLAKDAFRKALELNSQSVAAKLNLAGLYQYYGHFDKAGSIYDTMPENSRVEQASASVHPRAMEFYYERIRHAKK